MIKYTPFNLSHMVFIIVLLPVLGAPVTITANGFLDNEIDDYLNDWVKLFALCSEYPHPHFLLIN